VGGKGGREGGREGCNRPKMSHRPKMCCNFPHKIATHSVQGFITRERESARARARGRERGGEGDRERGRG
jgi:hypothetical protein